MCPMAPDLASPLRRGPVLSCAPRLQTSLRLRGRLRSVYPIAPDSTSLHKGALMLSRIHGTLWAIGIKKDLTALCVQ
jgi:hypothetical protein